MLIKYRMSICNLKYCWSVGLSCHIIMLLLKLTITYLFYLNNKRKRKLFFLWQI